MQPVSDARADGHSHARADRRNRHAVRNAIGEEIEERNGDRDGDYARQFRMQNSECRNDASRVRFCILHSQFRIIVRACVSRTRTLFMSSHTSRFADGLRSRYAG